MLKVNDLQVLLKAFSSLEYQIVRSREMQLCLHLIRELYMYFSHNALFPCCHIVIVQLSTSMYFCLDFLKI